MQQEARAMPWRGVGSLHIFWRFPDKEIGPARRYERREGPMAWPENDSRERSERAGRYGVDLATTRKGTPGGMFMRQFWIAVHDADQLAPGRAKPIRIMGENYAIYRGRSGEAQ